MVASIFTQDEVEFIKDNYASMDTAEIAEKLGKTRKQVKGKADGLGLRKGVLVTRFTKEEEQFLIDNYETMESCDIAKVIDKTVKQINDKAFNMGLKKEKTPYTLDVDFFKIIDTEEKAYWLGFLYADGCISVGYDKEKTRIKSLTLEVGLSEIDRSHLERFADSIGSNGVIKDKKVKIGDKTYNAVRFNVYNTEMCRDLINLGCTPKKSLTLEFPTKDIVPDELINHFIRGYFDGDGCSFYKHDTNAYIVNFVGTKHFLDGIYDEMSKECNINKTAIRKKGSAYQVSWGGFSNFRIIGKYLYKNSTICLDRKKEKFIDAIDTKEYVRNVAYYHRNMMV